MSLDFGLQVFMEGVHLLRARSCLLIKFLVAALLYTNNIITVLCIYKKAMCSVSMVLENGSIDLPGLLPNPKAPPGGSYVDGENSLEDLQKAILNKEEIVPKGEGYKINFACEGLVKFSTLLPCSEQQDQVAHNGTKFGDACTSSNVLLPPLRLEQKTILQGSFVGEETFGNWSLTILPTALFERESIRQYQSYRFLGPLKNNLDTWPIVSIALYQGPYYTGPAIYLERKEREDSRIKESLTKFNSPIQSVVITGKTHVWCLYKKENFTGGVYKLSTSGENVHYTSYKSPLLNIRSIKMHRGTSCFGNSYTKIGGIL